MSEVQRAAGIERVEVSEDVEETTLHFRPRGPFSPPPAVMIPTMAAHNAALTILHAASNARKQKAANSDATITWPVGNWRISTSLDESQVILTLEVEGTQAALSFALPRIQAERFAEVLDAGLGRIQILPEGSKH